MRAASILPDMECVETMTRMKRLGSAFAWMQLDFHVFVTLLFRSWSIIAGGVTILLIPTSLSPVQQGYYYTFASILALQIFFELGMSQVVVQIVAHEAVNLTHDPEHGYQGAPRAIGRLASIGYLLGKWYLIAALLFLLATGIAGTTFFRNGELPWHQWGLPWLALVAATAGNLWISWKMAFVEGFALVGQVSRLRLTQSITGFGCMWAVLVAGGGLWAVAIVPAVAFVMSFYWLRKSTLRQFFSRSSETMDTNSDFSWRREIFPFQWRIAVSWISGYFIFQLFTPLIFKHDGAVEAGRVGLGITMFNAVGTVGSSWVAAKVPVLASLLSQGDRNGAISLFRRLLKATMSFMTGISIVLILCVWGLQHSGTHLASRLPSMPVFCALALAQVASSFIWPAATFMRAHKEEPMLAPSVAMAVLTSAAVYLLAPFGAAWAVGGYTALAWIVSLPWTAILLRGYLARTSPVLAVDPA